MIKNEQPLVSVVMSCYNGELYLKETIESILAQTYSNLEFIIWDDGSTDRSKEIVDSFDDERIRYFYHENTGLGMALYLACEQVKGKYIARIDGDDIAYPERLKREVEFLESHPDYVLVSSAVDYIDEEGNTLGRSLPCTIDRVLRGSIDRGNMIVHPMVMLRYETYLKTCGYSGVYYYEDILLWSRLANLGKFHNIPTPLGQYRLLKKSLSRSENKYRPIMFQFIKKMAKDSVLMDTDIDMYNCIYKLSKKNCNTNEKGISRRKETAIYRVYKIIKPLFGEHISQTISIFFTNLYHLLKMELLRINK